MSGIIAFGNYTVEKRFLNKKVQKADGTVDWVPSDKEAVILRKFFGSKYSQMKIPVEDVPGVIQGMAKAIGIEVSFNGHKEVKSR